LQQQQQQQLLAPVELKPTKPSQNKFSIICLILKDATIDLQNSVVAAVASSLQSAD
jgi:hypothetical protein